MSDSVVVVQDALSLERLEKLCNGAQADWKIPDFKDSGKKCVLSSGACHRVFRQSILGGCRACLDLDADGNCIGVSGDFTADEVELIERCIPDGVAYVESDVQVIKAEGPRPDSQRRLPSVNSEDAFPTVHIKSKDGMILRMQC